MKNKYRYKSAVFLLFFVASQNSMGVVTPNPWFYTGDDAIPGGEIGVMNLADVAGYTANDFVHMAAQYWTPIAPVTFKWSTLSLDSNGGITPDPVMGYDANVIYVSGDYSPANWDGFTLTYNELDQPCSTINDLTTIPPDVLDNDNCDAALGGNPNIAYAIVVINTNGGSSMTPIQDKRRSIVTHEMGHVLGMFHSTTCKTPGASFGTSSSVMEWTTNPANCSGAFTTLQADDINALNLIY